MFCTMAHFQNGSGQSHKNSIIVRDGNLGGRTRDAGDNNIGYLIGDRVGEFDELVVDVG